MKRIIFVLAIVMVLAIGAFAFNNGKIKASGLAKTNNLVNEAKDPVYMGGIILCNEHRVECGVEDGICPEDYADRLCKPKDPDCR